MQSDSQKTGFEAFKVLYALDNVCCECVVSLHTDILNYVKLGRRKRYGMSKGRTYRPMGKGRRRRVDGW